MVFDGSPSGATYVSVEWIQQSVDAQGSDRAVSRADATAARVVEIGGSNSGSRILSAAEAAQYVAQLEEFIAQRKREIEKPPDV